MTLSMVLIARDEADNINRCFESFWDAVDQVVLCDTGSTDGTIAAARAFAKKRRQTRKLIVGHFPWVDDFAAARNHADSLATGDWVTWADLDDTVHGLDQLNLNQIPASIAALTGLYEYARDPHGNVVSSLWRERVVRRGVGEWRGVIHEVKIIEGAFQQLPTTIRWAHHRDHTGPRPTRNVRMLQAWNEREPGNPRCLHYLGEELMGLQRYEEAAAAFREHLAIPGEHPDVRAQSVRKLCMCLGALPQPSWEEMRDVCGRAIVENPLWPDTQITLAEIANDQGNHQVALHWADQVIGIGVPQTSLVVNPTQYTLHPRMLRATALWGLGRHDEALAAGREVMAAAPNYLGMGAIVQGWEGQVGAVNGVRSLIAMADVLSSQGEPRKARRLLDCAPAAIVDHPMLTERKVQLDRALSLAPHTVDQVRGIDEASRARTFRDWAGTVAILDSGAIRWDPVQITTTGLGGLETSAWRVARELAKKGYDVTLYGEIAEERDLHDVLVRHRHAFNPMDQRDLLIAYHDASVFEHPTGARTNMLWLTNAGTHHGLTPRRAGNIDHVLALSGWHANEIRESYPWLDEGKVARIRNGIHPPFFEHDGLERERRVVYSSTPDRGLGLLLDVWPAVRDRAPDAKLVVTYPGYADRFDIKGLLERADSMADQGVSVVRGGMSQDHLARLMLTSRVWAYPAWNGEKVYETSCIGAMEAQAAGLTVVCGGWGALPETAAGQYWIVGDPATSGWRAEFTDVITAALQHEPAAGQRPAVDLGWDGVADMLLALLPAIVPA